MDIKITILYLTQFDIIELGISLVFEGVYLFLANKKSIW